MDGRRFDALARSLATAASRRHVLRAFGAGLASAVLARATAHAQGGLDPRAAAAAEAAREISRLEAAYAFDALYDLLHPDAQAIVPREVVVGWYGEYLAGRQAGELTVTAVRFIAWTWPVTGVVYHDTAEVDYVQPFWRNGARVDEAETIRLVEAEGAWRWFFGRSRAFVEEQIARFAGTIPTIVPAGEAAPTATSTRTVAYTITDLGVLEGAADSSRATAINNAGAIVGSSYLAGHPLYCAFLWEGGRMRRLGTDPVTLDCLGDAADINDKGQIAGSSFGFEVPSTAYLWEDGEVIDLGKLPGDVTAFAHGVNALGQVVGESSAPTYFTQEDDRPPRAFLHDGSRLRELPPLPGGTSSCARAINDVGQIVGSTTFADGTERAVLWQDGQVSDLGVLEGHSRSRAFAINGAGQAVGTSDLGYGGSGVRAVLFSDGAITDLGVSPGGNQSYAYDINASGHIVGGSGLTGAEIGWAGHAFLYADGQMVNLNDLIPADAGWWLSWANGINNAGQIVGSGTIDGQTHAYLLTPVGFGASTVAGLDYFALGDSIAAGHGLIDADGPDPPECCADGQDACRTNPRCCQTCRRSEQAYPYTVRDLLRDAGYEVVAFEHLACTGARATDPGNPNLPRHKWLHNQVDDVLARLSDRPTLVTITIGANDFEWANPQTAVYRFAQQDDGDFFRWIDETSAAATAALREELTRLLARPNVAVVITDVFNPFNTESWFFDESHLLAPVLCQPRGAIPIIGDAPHYQSCYGRTEWGVTLLQTSYLALVGEHQRSATEAGRPERLAIAQLRQLFQGHESPRGEPRQPTRTDRRSRRPCCGDALPDVADTWIQHRYDDRSNSRPCLEGEWTGDCFHPNEEGARQIAAKVADATLPLLSGREAVPGERPRITASPTVDEITATSAVVSWSTDQPTIGSVEYGRTERYGRTRPRTPGNPTTDHRVALDNLDPGQSYHYHVRSTNTGGEAVSADRTFSTLADVTGHVTVMALVCPAQASGTEFPAFSVYVRVRGAADPTPNLLDCSFSDGFTFTITGADGSQVLLAGDSTFEVDLPLDRYMIQEESSGISTPFELTPDLTSEGIRITFVAPVPTPGISPTTACRLEEPCGDAQNIVGCLDSACCFCFPTAEGGAACVHGPMTGSWPCISAADCPEGEICIGFTNGNPEHVCAPPCGLP